MVKRKVRIKKGENTEGSSRDNFSVHLLESSNFPKGLQRNTEGVIICFQNTYQLFKIMKSVVKTIAIILFSLAYHLIAQTPTHPEIEQFRQKIIEEQLSNAVNVPRVEEFVATIREDGTWAHINYVDVSRTGFQHSDHLSHMVEMSLAYKKKGSKLQGNTSLKNAINGALNYWLAHDFICENWWWNQIGTPTYLLNVLLMMDTDLTQSQITKTLPMIGRAHLNASGARPSGDRIKIAGILAKTLLYNRDATAFDTVIRVIEGEIKFATERGMQYDYSFHHRVDRVNNTLSYGLGYADAFVEWAALVARTKYQFSDRPLHQLIDYYLDGICKMMVYGKYPDPGVMNRDITREGSSNPFSAKTPEKLLQTTDYRKKELTEIVKIRQGQTETTLSHSTFFWQTEHFTFQRPHFFTSVRMYSTRNDNMEEPYNGEGLMNHHRADGTNYISRTGTEYADLAPVYDWQKIPGATIVQKNEMPKETDIQKHGLTDFVGAVTDGLYGAVAFDFKSPHDPLAAKKGWFFFDNAYVCLGAGIRTDAKKTVVTTLNQCLLRGDVVVKEGKEKTTVQQGEHQLINTQWIFHDGIAYIFPQPQKVVLSNRAQTGSWFKVNRQSDSPKDEISKDVFKLWLDHGQQPQDAQYQYIVMPEITEKEIESIKPAIEILSNTTDIQAVKNTALNLYQMIFYKSGDIKMGNNLTIGMDSPGIVMIKTDGSAVKQISVADPSRKLRKIHLTINRKIEKTGDNVRVTWNASKGISEIAIDLPQTVYAGKSVTIKL